MTQASDVKDLDEKVTWLALQDSTWLIPAKEVVRAYHKFGSLKPLSERSFSDLRSLDIGEISIRKLFDRLNHVKKDALCRDLEYLEKTRTRLIRFIDREYPKPLQIIENPPLMLFHRGALLDFDNCVAIAGTRDCSWYGRNMARRLAKAIASKGYTIVSGLARGTDEWAHYGALEAPKGTSIAVLPWMRPIYPSEHSQLLESIERRGAAISELLDKPFGRIAKAKFVQRNRVTSGISRCLLALESGKEGGTAHQVRIAVSQDRKVFALKPKNNELFKEGFETFIDMGAAAIESTKDVLRYLRQEAPLKARDKKIDSYYQHYLVESGDR